MKLVLLDQECLLESVLPVTIFNDFYEVVSYLLNEGIC